MLRLHEATWKTELREGILSEHTPPSPVGPPFICIVTGAELAFSAQASKMSRVYIGRLSYRARENDVERFFKGYGKILEVDLKNG